MNAENTKYLIEKYPKLFADVSKPMTESLMCFGLECNDGWFKLVDSLCNVIQWRCDQVPECPQVVFGQIKEKFAQLRIYYDGGDDYTMGVIDMAEQMSEHVCEVCGNAGRVREGGWWMTLCDACNEKRYKKKESLADVLTEKKREILEQVTKTVRETSEMTLGTVFVKDRAETDDEE